MWGNSLLIPVIVDDWLAVILNNHKKHNKEKTTKSYFVFKMERLFCLGATKYDKAGNHALSTDQ